MHDSGGIPRGLFKREKPEEFPSGGDQLGNFYTKPLHFVWLGTAGAAAIRLLED